MCTCVNGSLSPIVYVFSLYVHVMHFPTTLIGEDSSVGEQCCHNPHSHQSGTVTSYQFTASTVYVQ